MAFHEIIFGGISVAFGPIIALGPLMAITIITLLESLLITLIYKWMIPRGKMQAIKEEMTELRKKIKAAQKEKKDKEMKEHMDRSLKLSREQMSLTMKPMLVSMVPVLIILPWLGWEFSMARYGAETLFALPFWMPLLGPDISWFGLFLILTLPASMVFRKLLGVD